MKPMEISRKHFEAAYSHAYRKKLDNPEDPNDRYLKLYSEAGLACMAENQYADVRNAIWESYQESGMPWPPSYGANKILRVIQYDALLPNKKNKLDQPRDPTYPLAYNNIESWCGLFRRALVDNYEDTIITLQHKEIRSNIDDRYKNVKIWCLANRDRLGDEPEIMDFGASRNHGLNRLALNHRFPFEPVTVLGGDYEKMNISPQDIVKGKTQTLNHDYILNDDFKIGPSMGIDIAPLKELSNYIWVKSCSSYPNELLDIMKQERFKLLEKEADEVSFAQVDATDRSKLEDALGKIQPKIVVISAMLYMLSLKEQRAVVENAKALASDFVMSFEFADADKKTKTGLRVYTDFNARDRKYGWKTSVLDVKKPKQGFQEIFRWNNGRCNRTIPNLGNAAVRQIFGVK